LVILGKQRIVFAGRKGSLSLWAWAVSIGLHVIILMALQVVSFTRIPAADKYNTAPAGRLSWSEQAVEAARIVPKPKVKRLVGKRPAQMRRVSAVSSIFRPVKHDTEALEGWTKLKPSKSQVVLDSDIILPYGVEFFELYSSERRICFVVDCSGSMKGMFAKVRERLTESVKALQSDQYFAVIFFGNNKLLEFEKAGLVRAGGRAKQKACEFIGSVEPAGQTNAAAAMERAVQIRDCDGVGASVIYFLTDGFELVGKDAEGFLHQTMTMLQRNAPQTKINTIGFWPAEQDRAILEMIAEQSGGEFVLVEDTGLAGQTRK